MCPVQINCRRYELWNSKLSKKCRFFVWSLFHESINSVDNLQKRLPNTYLHPNRCVLCKSIVEDMNHIFISCHFTKSLSVRLFSQVGRHLDTNNTNSLCLFHDLMKQTNRKNIICLNAGVVLLWSVWVERNNRIFKSVEKSLVNI